MPATRFQVKLGGQWQDYGEQEDKILKRAYMAGFQNAKFELRGQKYMYDFSQMKQINAETKKERQIRPPLHWKPPSKPLVPAGPTMTITVPPGSPGTAIQVPHPQDRNKVIVVNVPVGATVGQAMLVPVPNLTDCGAAAGGGVASSGGAGLVDGALLGGAVAPLPTAGGAAAPKPPVDGDGAPKPSAPPAPAGGPRKGWTTGAAVAAGATGAVVGAAAAAGGVLVAEHGVEGAADVIADTAADAGGAIGDAAAGVGDWVADASDFVMDAADDMGDFVMDLF